MLRGEIESSEFEALAVEHNIPVEKKRCVLYFYFVDIETETDSVSLGGWVMEQLGSVPHTDDNFVYDNLEITITETDAHRVVTVKVVSNEKTEDESEAVKTNEK